MHTPGHVLLNVAVLGSIVGHERAVVAGAIVPDLPIVILYLRERLRGRRVGLIVCGANIDLGTFAQQALVEPAGG